MRQQGNFNSIKVRLKRDNLSEIDKFTQFQFHKGTIKTYVKASKMLLTSHFNSIKVRLKQEVSCARADIIAISIP